MDHTLTLEDIISLRQQRQEGIDYETIAEENNMSIYEALMYIKGHKDPLCACEAENTSYDGPTTLRNGEEITYENCTCYNWLNEDFYSRIETELEDFFKTVSQNRLFATEENLIEEPVTEEWVNTTLTNWFENQFTTSIDENLLFDLITTYVEQDVVGAPIPENVVETEFNNRVTHNVETFGGGELDSLSVEVEFNTNSDGNPVVSSAELMNPEGYSVPIVSPVHDDSPWREKAVLEELYRDMLLDFVEIAHRLGCHNETIRSWTLNEDRHNIGAGENMNHSASKWAKKLYLSDSDDLPSRRDEVDKYDEVLIELEGDI